MGALQGIDHHGTTAAHVERGRISMSDSTAWRGVCTRCAAP
jgi:hypothetical protein